MMAKLTKRRDFIQPVQNLSCITVTHILAESWRYLCFYLRQCLLLRLQARHGDAADIRNVTRLPLSGRLHLLYIE